MSDDRFGIQRTTSAVGEPVSQVDIDDVLNDPRLSPAERQARLSELRQRILDDRHADGNEEYEPLGTRIADALSMLAEGGHDYDGSLRVEGDGAGGRGEFADDDQATGETPRR
ncbi:MAG: hypothetical protein INR68_17665 [Methylobacterium mesophilicum]|nr:hypothetical protein [Methylobacterium mesophilicum]